MTFCQTLYCILVEASKLSHSYRNYSGIPRLRHIWSTKQVTKYCSTCYTIDTFKMEKSDTGMTTPVRKFGGAGLMPTVHRL